MTPPKAKYILETLSFLETLKVSERVSGRVSERVSETPRVLEEIQQNFDNYKGLQRTPRDLQGLPLNFRISEKGLSEIYRNLVPLGTINDS